MTASYGTPYDFIAFLAIFIHYYLTFISELLYLFQTFTDCIFNQYWYVKIPDETASYGMPLNFMTFFVNFAQNCWIFMSKLLYLHQTFMNYVFDVNMKKKITIKCQMWLQVIERSLILLRSLDIFIHYWRPFISEVLYLHQTFTDCMSIQYKYSDMLTCQMLLQVMEGSLV